MWKESDSIRFPNVSLNLCFERNRFDETNTTYDSNLYARPRPTQGIIPSLLLSMPVHGQRPPFCPVMYPSNPSSSLLHRAAWSSPFIPKSKLLHLKNLYSPPGEKWFRRNRGMNMSNTRNFIFYRVTN